MKIIHLSDLHFGRDLKDVGQNLLYQIETIQPDLVIISGDFTQLATTDEFINARDFIKALPVPYFCVPGNHDIPAVNLFARMFHPYQKYKKYIDEDLNPDIENTDVMIAGINSARRILPHWNWANGAVSNQQRMRLHNFFSDANKHKWRICVLHHPIHKVNEMPISVTVFGRKRALSLMNKLNIDLVLTGHVHYPSVSTHGNEKHQTVFVSASTALSSRKRGGQENGFNVISLSDKTLDVALYTFQNGQFQRQSTYAHKRS